MADNGGQIDRLVAIMAMLRGEGGCPWDRQQTHESLKRYLIEETYELIEAIDSLDDDRLAEELGDLLLQIVFHAQVAQERGAFDMGEVARRINEKLIRRHPHVFQGQPVQDLAELWHNWETIKKRERRGPAGGGCGNGEQETGKAGVLDGVPRTLPALLRAYVTQRKAAHVGWEGPSPEAALREVAADVQELAHAELDRGAAEQVLARLLFAIVAWACHANIDPEDALRQAVDRFCEQFAGSATEGPSEGASGA